jgi:hypothetical protein
MSDIGRLSLDVLKPHDPDLVAFCERVAEVPSVERASARLLERDREVENCQLTVEGASVDRDAVGEAVESFGASVHSIDEVVCGDGVDGP